MKNRYAITHIKADGLRVLSCANQGHNHFDTERAALDHLAAMLNPATNRPGVMRSVFGPHYFTTMRVQPVKCYDHGDACASVFEYSPQHDLSSSPSEDRKLAHVMASL